MFIKYGKIAGKLQGVHVKFLRKAIEEAVSRLSSEGIKKRKTRGRTLTDLTNY